MLNRGLQGTSLTELLLACCLGLMLLLSIGYFYQANTLLYQHQEALAYIQDNAKTAIRLLNQRIRMAGYVGCGGLGKLTSAQQLIPIGGSTSAVNLLPSTLRHNRVSGSDAIMIGYMKSLPVNLAHDTPASSSSFYLSDITPFKVHDKVIISDCHYAEQRSILALDTSQHALQLLPLTSKHSAHHRLYKKTSEVGLWQRHVFYLAKSEFNSSSKQPIYALFDANLDSPYTPREIALGIDAMRIDYGLKARTGELLFKKANQLQTKDRQKIVAVRITLSVNSVIPVTAASFTRHQRKSDGRLRRQWQTIIALRQPVRLT